MRKIKIRRMVSELNEPKIGLMIVPGSDGETLGIYSLQENGDIKVTTDQWPTLKQAIDEMFASIQEYKV